MIAMESTLKWDIRMTGVGCSFRRVPFIVIDVVVIPCMFGTFYYTKLSVLSLQKGGAFGGHGTNITVCTDTMRKCTFSVCVVYVSLFVTLR